MGLVAPWHVGSSRTRARTRVPCIGRWILNHCAIREALDDSLKRRQRQVPKATRAGLGEGGPRGVGTGHGAVPDSRGIDLSPGFIWVIRGELPISGGNQESATLNHKDAMALPVPGGGNTSFSCLLPSTSLKPVGSHITDRSPRLPQCQAPHPPHFSPVDLIPEIL